MSLIGTLEQINVSSVLQRIEAHEKTGLLTIKQSTKWVEFYVRDGRLMCIGPLRTNATLAERLLHDEVISPPIFQEIMRTLGVANPSEIQTTLFLMERGFVGQEALRSWATGKVLEVLQAMLNWSNGEIYFEEAVAPAEGRLLVAMSFSSLLASLPAPSITLQPVYETSPVVQAGMQKSPAMPSIPTTPAPDISRVAPLMDASRSSAVNTPPALSRVASQASPPAANAPVAESYIDASQLLMESMPSTFPFGDTPTPLAGSGPFTGENTIGPVQPYPATGSLNGYTQAAPVEANSSSPSISQPVPVSAPLPPPYVDISYMRPEMVLMPSDLSAWREQNPPVQLTPDQWRLLTRVDGQSTLQAACHDLAMPPEVVCRIAGELVAYHLVQLGAASLLSIPTPGAMPVPREMVQPDVYNSYAASLPTSDVLPQYSSFVSFETQSQWGNGGNGATFVPGHGWIASPQPLQPLQSSGPIASYTGSYARVDQRIR